MESPQPAPPVSRTGLPPGVEVGGLGKRFVAQLIDRLVPALIAATAAYFGSRIGGTDEFLAVQIAALVLILAWALFVWWGFALRAAGPGMRLMHLQLVGFYDGRPIGWVRYLLRTLVLWALSATGIGLLLMLIFLLAHPRKQGWHDLVADAVVIKQRALAPPKPKAGAEQRQPPESIPQGQQDQAAAAPSPYSGQHSPAPQPLVPPTGVEANYSPVPGPLSSGPADQPNDDPYAAAGLRPSPSDYSQVPSGAANPYQASQPGDQRPPPDAAAAAAGAAAQPPLTPPEGVSAGAPATPSAERSQEAGSPPEEAATTTARVRPVAVPRDANAQTGWLAVLDDGREIPVNGLVLLGRNPQPQPGEEDAQLIKIADDTRTVSKSHLAIATDADGAFVVDRGSTNGSTVTASSGVSTRCQVGERVRVAEGSIVSIGDHWLEIRHRSE
jgi:uncharacterized RDD family membrane protein YckC